LPYAFAQFGGQPDEPPTDVDLPGFVVEAAAGWDGTVSSAAPVPISFLLSNHTERIIEGDLVLSDPINGTDVTLGEVVVAPGATMRFASIQALSNWAICFASLRHHNQVLWRRELDLATGKSFTFDASYVLFIDDNGRKLQLPGIGSDAATATTDADVPGGKGRTIECLTVKSWQVPDHPGPLVVAQAAVFPTEMAPSNLNRLQWRALAEWMCRGGTLFIHNESRAVVDRLIESAPLDSEPPVSSGKFTVRRLGLGAIYEYPTSLFAKDRGEIQHAIAALAANLQNDQHRQLFESISFDSQRGGQADKNRMRVAIFIGGYTFFTGIVTLFMFRVSRRRVGIYIVAVVILACVVAGLLGGVLRFSRGDLRWLTVTHAGAGGAVQFAKIDLQSAGGRNTKAAISGERADVQLIEQRPYRWATRRLQWAEYVPFTWQPNRAGGQDDRYQIHVPMTPWGSRQLVAAAYKRALPRLDFQLEFEPVDVPTAGHQALADARRKPTGLLTLKLVNRLPFALTNCWLVVGATQRVTRPSGSVQSYAGQAGNTAGRAPGGSRQPGSQTDEGLSDVYHVETLPGLAAGASFERKMQTDFQPRNYRGSAIRVRQGYVMHPQLARLGTANAWIVGAVEKSPSMEIDTEHSDFIPQDATHLFVQEILPEEMPDASLFLGPDNPPSK
jgi:hypothetical protein